LIQEKTLGDLKIAIASELDISIDTFVMTKRISKFTYKDMSKIIKEADLYDSSHLVIEHGVELKQNEASIKLYLFEPLSEEEEGKN